MHSLVGWLQNHMINCMFKEYVGIDCPGCGMQRSMILLLQGNLGESIKMFPALIPILGMLSFLALHLSFQFKHGAGILKFMFLGTASIIWLNYLFKLIN